MLSSLLLAGLMIAADVPSLESDEENREACRAAAAHMRQAERVQSQIRCRDEYFRRAKEVQAIRAAAAEAERQARAEAKRAAEAARAAALAEEQAARRAAAEAEEARLKPIREAAAAEANAKWAAEEKEARLRREAEARRDAAEEAVARAQEAKARAAKEAQERACGADLMRVEVGMAWETVKACAGPFTSVGQVQRPEGVVSTYSAPGGVVQVLKGKVVAWRRR